MPVTIMDTFLISVWIQPAVCGKAEARHNCQKVDFAKGPSTIKGWKSLVCFLGFGLDVDLLQIYCYRTNSIGNSA